MFDTFKGLFGSQGVHSVSESLSEAINKESARKKAFENAKEFASDFQESLRVFSQFFDMTPKVGRFGHVGQFDKKDADNTQLTMNDDFLPGYKVSFIFDEKGVVAFLIEETDQEPL